MNSVLTRVIVWLADPSPSPSSAYTGDENLITPGVVGFAVTFLIALATVFLLIDMSRRMRRVRYRSEVREQLEAERLLAESESTGGKPDDDER
ncbi:MAG: hypothetical protein JWP19_973 [Rhodoglobus sp.]|jgi:hypothetical protein|nr:hypothetical protein [Rhodoglobus sp.]